MFVIAHVTNPLNVIRKCCFLLDNACIYRCIIRDQCPIKPEGVKDLAVQNVTDTTVMITFDHTSTAESYDIVLTSTEDSIPGKIFKLNVSEDMTEIVYEFTDLIPGKPKLAKINYTVAVTLQNHDQFQLYRAVCRC